MSLNNVELWLSYDYGIVIFKPQWFQQMWNGIRFCLDMKVWQIQCSMPLVGNRGCPKSYKGKTQVCLHGILVSVGDGLVQKLNHCEVREEFRRE